MIWRGRALGARGASLGACTRLARGAGATARQKLIEEMKPGYKASITEKNVFVTKKLGEGYPQSWPLMDILSNWSPDQPQVTPKRLFQSMRHFDYETDLDEVGMNSMFMPLVTHKNDDRH